MTGENSTTTYTAAMADALSQLKKASDAEYARTRAVLAQLWEAAWAAGFDAGRKVGP